MRKRRGVALSCELLLKTKADRRGQQIKGDDSMNTIKRGIGYVLYLMFDSEVSIFVLPIVAGLLFAGAMYLFVAIADPEAVRNTLKVILATPAP
ncbi:hypothetical protein A2960_05755 [Candidatus Gottesmanbacteria bacterium RIFCSPLOWO2_01_FULL_39_12b]|uniref:Uncharacterized protein n=1 Tax=Candidatus Gottesmanbacteria bacterium RIFCSPLOWO2_01_FULL_39_12b TaxID=1798388 RepID=A0A1F6AMU9_9BACT|nr:MAG: hypothetical protein A2960_05755 [Candidatus Gottesmanbacteria bacterium RIFCSPLOWO2_01_FULL_39_12b]